MTRRRNAAADAYDKRRRADADRVAASLGPSNDDSPAVLVEMRAAALALSWDLPGETISNEEYSGWAARHDDSIPLDSDGRLAGWLSREIRYAGTERDIGTWAWDISRPIADQLAETAANDSAADALEAQDAANAAALVADLDANGPAYGDINDAFDAVDDADADADAGESPRPTGCHLDPDAKPVGGSDGSP